MSKTIKVIDLFNKIVNGEEVPRKIKYYDENYILNEGATSIENLYLIDSARVGWLNHADFSLNSTVEIIEEQEEIDIQSLKETEIKNDGIDYYEYITDSTPSGCAKNYNVDDIDTRIRINQLVQAVKQLDRKIKEK